MREVILVFLFGIIKWFHSDMLSGNLESLCTERGQENGKERNAARKESER